MTRARLVKALRMVVAAAILGWVGWRLAQDWQALAELELVATPAALAAAALSGLGALVLLALLFGAILRATGLARPGLQPYYARTWLQSYFHRYVPGKVLLVVERVRMGQIAGIPRSTSVVLVLWETVLLLIGACLAGGIGLALAGSSIAGAPSLPAVLGVAMVGLVGVSLAPAILRAVIPRIPKLGSRIPPLALDAPPLAWLGLSLGYAAVWTLLGTSFAFTCRWFPQGADAGVEEALWYVLAYVGGMVVGLTPAGLGIREGLLVAGLATRYDAPTAMAFALASRVLLTAIELPLVGLATRIPEPSTDNPHPM